MPIITRTQYMDDSRALFHDYYAQFATEETRHFILSRIGPKKLRSSKCEHLNDLYKDSDNGRGTWIWDHAPYSLAKMREAGEVSANALPSPAARTCTAKVCARILLAEAAQAT